MYVDHKRVRIVYRIIEEVIVVEVIASALSEKIASLRTEEYLQERANRGSRAHALSMLKNAPDVKPVEGDEV